MDGPALTLTTITLKLQLAVLPEASVAVQVTVLVPTANVLPDGGEQFVVTPGQLSNALTDQLAVVVFVSTMSAGQVIVGFSVSLTITLKLQLAVPHSFDAVQLTVLVPTVNALPEAGVHVTVGVGLPVALALNETLLEHCPATAGTVMSAGQVIVGPAFTVKDVLHEFVQPVPFTMVTLYVPPVLTSIHWLLAVKPPGPVHE
jgi:hypothetical protein